MEQPRHDKMTAKENQEHIRLVTKYALYKATPENIKRLRILDALYDKEIPRRNRLDLSTPAELAIRQAVNAVEAAGCHPLLTDAVNLLNQAREKVADYVDHQAAPTGNNGKAAK